MWLIASAAYAEMKVRGPAGTITLTRGEFCFSVRFLAERWQWSKSRVDRFLSALKNRDTIRDTQRDSAQVWIINKYNDFQLLPKPKRDTQRDMFRDTSGTAAGQQRDKEEDREDREDSKYTSSLRSDDSAPARPTPRQELSKVLDADRAAAIIDHRQKMRKPLTAHAAKLLAKDLAKWRDPNEAADEMISRGWQGFKPDWMRGGAVGARASPQKSAFRQHQDEVDQSFRDYLKGTPYEQPDFLDARQPSFDLDERDFFSDRTASTGKR